MIKTLIKANIRKMESNMKIQNKIQFSAKEQGFRNNQIEKMNCHRIILRETSMLFGEDLEP